MAPDGTQIRPLVEGFRNATTIAWSTVSRWLVLSARFGTLSPEQGVWLVDVATGQRRLVAQGAITGVRWSPPGAKLVGLENTSTADKPIRQIVLFDLDPILSSQ